MSETRAILRSLATTYRDPGNVLTRANQVLSEDLHNNIFVALIFVCLDPQAGRLLYASAGHPGLLFDAQGQLRCRIRSEDPPLGVIDDHDFETHEYCHFRPGDTLLLYTDGIIEAFNQRDEQFGEHQLVETISNMMGQSSRKTVNEIFDRVRRFSGETAYQDDMTAVLVRVLGPRAS
jgi:sigma-B regulation protein RsbU (phosphoserine phosphatase)